MVTVASPRPARVGTSATVTATANDTTTGGSNIASARYSINGASPVAISTPVDGAYDGPDEALSFAVSSPSAGIDTVCVTAVDARGNATSSCVALVWYDPNQAGGFRFDSKNYEWLVVSGARAQYEGRGTVNGKGSYGLLVTAIDGRVSGGGGTDRLRLKVWNHSTGAVVYDSQPAAPDSADPTTVITDGSIVITR